MENKHTPEPWRTDTKSGFPCDIHEEQNMNLLASTISCHVDEVEAEANARRIVACVNACSGITTSELERVNGDVTPIFELLMQTTKQRDELLSALERIAAGPGDNRLLTAIQWAKEAIDKVKVGAVNTVADATGWIEWISKRFCPVEKGTMVIVRYRDGVEDGPFPALENVPSMRDAGPAFWGQDGSDNDIIAYRVVKGTNNV